MLDADAVSDLPPIEDIQDANFPRIRVTLHEDGFDPDPRVLEIGTSPIPFDLHAFVSGFAKCLEADLDADDVQDNGIYMDEIPPLIK